ncbi:hypothetical protein BHE74_00020789 [Ensete ventricosum]|nr:hypothetical protein GW17_00055582 [Ensete ventricosum]RWW71473.1 hypothetical protein BHE74_00020789 [Ensete ventricosum]RZS09868.1 hypothetical protein BHM03_00040995 [Ensete ventricosum]
MEAVGSHRRQSVSELQTSEPTAATATSSSSSLPTHRVTVHDRQRGVVHEFLVPEVSGLWYRKLSYNKTYKKNTSFIGHDSVGYTATLDIVAAVLFLFNEFIYVVNLPL